MTDDFINEIKQLNNGKPSIYRIDKKVDFMILKLNDVLELYHKAQECIVTNKKDADKKIQDMKNNITWFKGYLTAAGVFIGALCFFFVKMWDKVFK